MIIEHARKILQQAHQSLRTAMSNAIESSDYAALKILADWAAQLEAMMATGQPSKHSGRSSIPHVDCAGLKCAAPGTQKAKARAAEEPPKRVVFLREGDAIVKEALSRDKGSSYRHRAPKLVLDALIAVLRRVPNGETLISMDDVLPLRDGHSGVDVPSYQAYVCLAWLREEGLVEQHGRSGYTISEPQTLAERAEAAYQRLGLADQR